MTWEPGVYGDTNGHLSDDRTTLIGDTGFNATVYTASFPKNTKIYAEFDIKSINGNLWLALLAPTQNGDVMYAESSAIYLPVTKDLTFTDPSNGARVTVRLGGGGAPPTDFVMMAWDGQGLFVGRNGEWISGDPAFPDQGIKIAIDGNELVFGATLASRNGTVEGNFGTKPFRYALPVGYLACQNTGTGRLPGEITNFAAVGVTQTSFTVSFNPDQDSTSYEMSRDGGPFLPVSIGDVVSGLTLGTTYQFLVRGVNAFGHGPDTPLTVKTVGAEPGPIGSVIVTDQTTTTARLVFTDAERADYHEYWVGQSYSDFVTWTRLPDDHIARNLPVNTTGTFDGAGYLYAAVRGVNAAGHGGQGISERFLPSNSAPLKVNNVVVSEITETSAKVTFDPATYATQQYQYRFGTGQWNLLNANGVITPLSKGTEFTIQIAGVNGWGVGIPSDPVTFTTPGSQVSSYATFDPARKGSTITLSNQNLRAFEASNNWRSALATVGAMPSAAKKLYAEFSFFTPNNRIMLVKDPYSVETISEAYVSFYNGGQLRVGQDLFYHNNNVQPDGFNAIYVGMLWDGSNVSFLINGQTINVYAGYWNGSDPISAPFPTTFSTTAVFGPSTVVYPAIAALGSAISVNFGATPWRYAPPAGYVGWSA